MSTRTWIALAVAALVPACGAKESAPPAPAAAEPAPPPAELAPEPEPAPTPAEPVQTEAERLAAAEQAAFAAAKPILEEHCAHCHTGGKSKQAKKALEHFSMVQYPYGGHHADELGPTIRKVLGVDGGKPTMPEDDPGAVKGAELDAVVAWTRAYDAAHAAGAGRHEGHHGDDRPARPAKGEHGEHGHHEH